MTSAVTRSVSIRMPRGWLEIDPRNPDVTAELTRTAREQWGDGVDAERIARHVAPMASGLRALADETGLVLAGFYADFLGDEDTPLLLTANATLAISPPVSITDLRHDLYARSAEKISIRTVDLPAGEGVLATCEVDLRRTGWTGSGLLHRYFVPVPDSSRFAVLSLFTPNRDLADLFADVFGAIAESLRFD
ncbi:hypothetical protein GCM10011609_02680 [Lentzea pudingi]|uniref:Uncharacterized protein n=1 Tax=Lentzea pudingi TaxID=1789439 RepID=A0ABQ2HAV4_9PSEU|nr:hypothetical protein [Lentzea pudingi]GGM70462.1 hypothetical protein GCM10011609_02680 [Lentzea pudingi]